MRLISTPPVVDAAETVIRRIMEAYADSNRTFDDMRQRVGQDWDDPLREFTEACKAELSALRAR